MLSCLIFSAPSATSLALRCARGQSLLPGDGHFYLLLPFTHEEGLRVIAERIRRLVGELRWPVAESITRKPGLHDKDRG